MRGCRDIGYSAGNIGKERVEAKDERDCKAALASNAANEDGDGDGRQVKILKRYQC